MQRRVQVQLYIFQGIKCLNKAFYLDSLVEKAVISTISKQVFELFYCSELVSLDLQRQEILQFLIGTLNKEILNFNSNNDFLIIGCYGTDFPGSFHSFDKIEVSTFTPQDSKHNRYNVEILSFENNFLLILYHVFIMKTQNSSYLALKN